MAYCVLDVIFLKCFEEQQAQIAMDRFLQLFICICFAKAESVKFKYFLTPKSSLGSKLFADITKSSVCGTASLLANILNFEQIFHEPKSLFDTFSSGALSAESQEEQKEESKQPV